RAPAADREPSQSFHPVLLRAVSLPPDPGANLAASTYRHYVYTDKLARVKPGKEVEPCREGRLRRQPPARTAAPTAPDRSPSSVGRTAGGFSGTWRRGAIAASTRATNG